MSGVRDPNSEFGRQVSGVGCQVSGVRKIKKSAHRKQPATSSIRPTPFGSELGAELLMAEGSQVDDSRKKAEDYLPWSSVC